MTEHIEQPVRVGRLWVFLDGKVLPVVAGGDGDEGDEDKDLLDGEEDSGDDSDEDSGIDGKIQAKLDEFLEDLDSKFNSVADRRVNALLRELRDQAGDDEEEDDEDEEDKPKAKRRRRQRERTSDVRGARLAAKEHLQDLTLTSEERTVAMQLVDGLVAKEAVRGFDDEEVVGQEVAREVSKSIKNLRKHYEQQIVRKLKRRGALVTQDGQPARGPGGKSAKSQWDTGASKAADMFGSREQAAS